jgi:TolB-like protein
VRFLPSLPVALERPSIAVLPFNLVGEETRRVAGMAEEIAAALMRLHWIGAATPERSRYCLRAKVRGDGRGRLRITVILTDASTGRDLWADHWDGASDDAFQFEQRVAGRVARAIELVLRDAEIDGVSGKGRGRTERLGAGDARPAGGAFV